MLYFGVGNIAETLINLDGRSGLLAHPGLIRGQMRGPRTFEYPPPPDGAPPMHSDGLTDRWNLDDLPGFPRHTPIVLAGRPLRESGVLEPGAGVFIAKGLS